jgi:hypothetical protein
MHENDPRKGPERVMMTMKRTTLVMLLAVAAVAILVGGCLVSGTKVFSENIGDVRATSSTSPNVAGANFKDNETFEEYSEKIRLVDRVGFTTTIQENLGAGATVSMYFSENANLTSAAQVEAEATPFVRDYVIPANANYEITYDESQKLLLNVEAMKEQIMTGEMWVYTISSQNFDIWLRQFTFTVTFTVGI